MAITFPTSPSLNDTHTVGNITWTWNGSSWTAAAAGSSYGDSDVATYLNGNWNTHILPDTNATYDIGSAEYKVRHLFLSDNSLKFVNSSDTEFSLGVNATGNKLEFENSHIATSDYETNDTTGAIDITKRNHFVTSGVNYTLANGTYIGQELWFYKSGVTALTYSDIVVDNAKVTLGSGATELRTAHPWRLDTTGGVYTGAFSCVWDGTGWCLNGGTLSA